MDKKRMRQLTKQMTEKQKKFCDFYIATSNASESAKKAGYAEKTARAIGYENLTKPYIQEYIDLRLAEMSNKRIAEANEVLEYLTGVMRGETKDRGNEDATIYDRNKAAELLGKRYRLFVDKQEIDANIEQVVIIDDIPMESNAD